MEKNYHTLRWPDQAIVLSWVWILLRLPFTFLYILKPWMFSEDHRIVVCLNNLDCEIVWKALALLLFNCLSWILLSECTYILYWPEQSTSLLFYVFNFLVGLLFIFCDFYLINYQTNLCQLFKCVYYSTISSVRVGMVCEKIEQYNFSTIF